MAKKNTLNDLNEFLKETQEGQDANTTEAKKTTTKEEFLAKEPSQLVDVNKAEKAATGTKKTATSTIATKTAAKKTATKTTAKATTSKPAAKKTTATKKEATTKTTTKTTTTKKAPAKTTAKSTTSKPAAKATTKKATAKPSTKKTTAPKVAITEEALLKQLDALAQKEGVTMREIWERVAVKIGAADHTKPTVAEEAFDSLVDIAMTPMNFLVSVSDRINKML